MQRPHRKLNPFKDVDVIDGCFETQIAVHTNKPVDAIPLFRARFNITHPEEVIATHLAFMMSGATIIRANTYHATIEGYMKYFNYNHEQAWESIKQAVRLAQHARYKFMTINLYEYVKKKPLVFASIGPYEAHLGGEVTGQYPNNFHKDNLTKFHRARIEACLEAGVDGLACETIPSFWEAEALTNLICTRYKNVKFWISFKCQDTRLINGDNFRFAVETVHKIAKNSGCGHTFMGAGIDCTHPRFVLNLLKSVNYQSKEKIPMVVCPDNSTLFDDDESETKILKNECCHVDNYIPSWIKMNAKLLGGCCRTYSKDIQRIKNVVMIMKQEPTFVKKNQRA